MASFEVVVEVARPVEDVFAYATDPAKVPEWNAMVEGVTATESPLRAGTKTRIRMRLLGRTIDGTQQVLEHEANRRLVVRTDQPFRVTDTWTFDAIGSKTRVSFASEGSPGGFFRLAEPIVARIAKKQLQAQLDTLKEILEAGSTEAR